MATSPKPQADVPDLSTRDAAQAWLGQRIRQIARLALLAVVLTPVAVVLVVLARTLFRGRGMPPLGDLVVVTLMWTAIVVPILLLTAALIGWKRLKVAQRVRPILADGEEHRGQVVDVQQTTRRGGGVTHYQVTVTVTLDNQTQRSGAIEEAEGSTLPQPQIGAPATAWTLGDRTVIATSGALFES